MARTDVTNVIERVRRTLESTVRMEVNVSATSLTTASTTVTFQYELANSVRIGAVLSMGTELMRVVSVNVAAKTADVIRGWKDSTPETHDVGDEILCNPRFTRFDIFDALIEEVADWEPDIFDIDFVEDTVTDSTQTYELALAYADCLGVISVRHKDADYTDSTVWPTVDYTLQRGGTSWTEASTSGLLIRFTQGIGYVHAGRILLTIAMPFDADAITEDSDLADLNITSGLLELLELGIKKRLIADDETGRTGRGIQDESRRTEEVPPGAALTAAEAMDKRYMRKRNNEVRKLRTKYPMRQW